MIRNRRLNALVCDLDLPLVPQDLAVQPWDRREVHTLFDGLEFRVLRERLFETLESEEEIDDSGSVTVHETETLLLYQPLSPSVPLTFGVMDGGDGSTIE